MQTQNCNGVFILLLLDVIKYIFEGM